MKNLFKTSIFIIIIILAACSNEEVTNYEYTFIGEGEFWKAEYIYEGTEIWGEEEGKTTYSNEDSDLFRITYKGSTEDIHSMKKLEYSYDTSGGSATSVREYDDPPNDTTFTIKGGGTGMKVKEDEIIRVNIKWDNFEEAFELTNQEK
ncbi:hypothetical protein ACJ2A9_23160 [Anaerobacillus sp. MEB173]|uniref:hypothetical protein n=1 Tax=Anaerobacillus sp. MEB173 TaxID=3383345 RepID=UPI003F9061A7